MTHDRTKNEKKSFIARSALGLSLALILIFSAAPVLCDDSAEGPSNLDRAFDAVVLRPLGALSVVAGAGMLVPAVLLGAPGGSEVIDDAYDVFLRTPWENLVDAPLGRGYGL